MPTVTELADALVKSQTGLKTYMDEHVKKNTDGTTATDEGGRPLYDLDAEGIKKVREMNADLDKAQEAHRAAKAEYDDVTRAHEAANARHGIKTEPGRRIVDGADLAEARFASRVPNLKALVDESADKGGLKKFRDDGLTGKETIFEINDPDEAELFLHGAKTLITLSDITPAATLTPTIVPSAQNRIFVSDMFAQGTTDGNSLQYYEETTFTNAAVEVAEGVAKPESALDFTLRTDAVSKIATWVPGTDEVLSDNRQLRSYIEGRLIYMVRQREEQQLLVGDGTAPNVSGILDRSGIQTQAKGGDPTPDAFFKAFVKVQITGDADPDGFVIHPNDWSDVRLLRTIDGIYIWGNPSETAAVRMWGYPGRVTTGITENTGLVGAFGTMAQIFRREGLTVVASTEHASFFIENKIAILAETRLALAVYRPAAFCSVTGI